MSIVTSSVERRIDHLRHAAGRVPVAIRTAVGDGVPTAVTR